MRRIIATSMGALAITGGSLIAAPAQAAGPVFTGGLVNVTVTDLIDGDVLSNNNVGLGVAAGVAANVCDVNVGGIIGQLRDAGTATCTSQAGDQVVKITQG